MYLNLYRRGNWQHGRAREARRETLPSEELVLQMARIGFENLLKGHKDNGPPAFIYTETTVLLCSPVHKLEHQEEDILTGWRYQSLSIVSYGLNILELPCVLGIICSDFSVWSASAQGSKIPMFRWCPV